MFGEKEGDYVIPTGSVCLNSTSKTPKTLWEKGGKSAVFNEEYKYKKKWGPSVLCPTAPIAYF